MNALTLLLAGLLAFQTVAVLCTALVFLVFRPLRERRREARWQAEYARRCNSAHSPLARMVRAGHYA